MYMFVLTLGLVLMYRNFKPCSNHTNTTIKYNLQITHIFIFYKTIDEAYKNTYTTQWPQSGCPRHTPTALDM